MLVCLQGSGFQLSVFKANQILKIGTSVDYGVCKGRRKDGLPCSIVVNKYVASATPMTNCDVQLFSIMFDMDGLQSIKQELVIGIIGFGL